MEVAARGAVARLMPDHGGATLAAYENRTGSDLPARRRNALGRTRAAGLPVHHVALQPTKLAIVYGLPSPEEFKESEVAQKRFPFGRSYVLGGCIPVEGKDTVDGFLCPECVKARAAWLKKHRD
jgi:hypothetical protein